MAMLSSFHGLRCLGCGESLVPGIDALTCETCGAVVPAARGIPDFSDGSYYDSFSDGDALTAEHLQGLANEERGTRQRIGGFYLPLLRRCFGDRALRVLDCGCGNGLSVELIDAAGHEGWGNDLSALRKWQWEQSELDARLLVADGARLPFSDAFFDCVISSGVLEHIGVAEIGGDRYRVTPLPEKRESRSRFVREVLRVTRPGGRVWLDFPNGSFPVDFWHGTRPGGARLHTPWEGFLPSPSEIRALVRATRPDARVTFLSPHGRLGFRQISAHWYGQALRPAAQLLLKTMDARCFRWLSQTPINPFLVAEVTVDPFPSGPRALRMR
jgi:SAM-dependent methyltransferase